MKTPLATLYLIVMLIFMVAPIKADSISPDRVPDQVKEKFHSLYPHIKEGVDWTKKTGRYEADFIYEDKSVSVLFNKHGELMNYKIEIDSTALPTAVLDFVKKYYLHSNYKILYVMKRWTKGKDLLYETAIIKGRKIYIVRNDESGKLTNEYVIDKVDILNPYYGKD